MKDFYGNYLTTLTMLLALLSGCANSKERKKDSNPPAKIADINGKIFTYDANITTNVYNYIEGAVAAIHSTPVDTPTSKKSEFINIFGSRPNLSQWLQERVRYIIPDGSTNRLRMILPSERSFTHVSIEHKNDEHTAAANIGTAWYLTSQKVSLEHNKRVVIAQEFNGEFLNILSPRVGIMKVGPALLSYEKSGMSLTGIQLLWAETLIHEGRHSDGNSRSKSLGFTHDKCPARDGIPSEFIGKNACDSYANGAYTAGAEALFALMAKSALSTIDASVLQATYLDSISRVIVPDHDQKMMPDSSPEPAMAPVSINGFIELRE